MSAFATQATKQAARKEHICALCGEPIPIGDLYLRWFFANYGEPGVVKVHLSCQEEAQDLEWYNDPDGWPSMYPLQEERENQRQELQL